MTEAVAQSQPAARGPMRGARRPQILREAARLFAARGIAATSTRDIADAVGIRSASLYHHFESKEQIVQDILAEPAAHLLEGYNAAEARSADPMVQLEGLLAASFATLQHWPDACAIFQNDFGYLSTLPAFAPLLGTFTGFQEVWLRVLRRGANRGQFRHDVPPMMFYRLCRDAVWTLVGPYRRGEIGEAEIADASRIYADLLLNGYASGSRRD
jgi:AcrR family transcriptional regulator